MSRTFPVVALLCAVAACSVGPEQGDARPDGARRLTRPEGAESNQNACFSPDGSFLVFTRFERGYNKGPAHLYRLDVAPGSAAVQLTSGDFDDVNVPYGCFDRSTGRVVFASDRGEANDLWTLDPLDPDAVPLRITTHGELPVWIEPVFSPDGAHIAFEEDAVDTTREAAARARVVTLTVSTGMTEIVANRDETMDDRLPSWSPDGTSILYQHRDPTWTDSLERWEATIVPVGGGTPTNLSAGVEVGQRGPDTDLSWMPDGRFVLTSTNPGEDEHPSIYLLPVAGGPLLRVSDAGGYEDGAACASPDGSEIAFESHRFRDENSPSDLWVVATPSGAR